MEAARAALPGDVAAITELARTAVHELGLLRGGPVWQLQDARVEPIEDGVAADVALRPDQGVAVVGTIDGTVVGYGVSRLEALSDGSLLAEVSDLYVDPDARGIGLGEAMMDLLVAHAEEAGAIGIDALALPGDRETKNFFETFGLKARAIVVHRSLRPTELPQVPGGDDASA
ncbi:MAG: GNAT family N-acetyltransferase [Aquihabitans sp.]